jgi:hypothetical protein
MYWTSTLESAEGIKYAHYVVFDSGFMELSWAGYRFFGNSVRLVYDVE